MEADAEYYDDIFTYIPARVVNNNIYETNNYIVIDNDFTYSPHTADEDGEGISLPEIQGRSTKIGFNTQDNRQTVHFGPEEKPVLCVLPGDDRSRLEQVPSIRRTGTKEEKNNAR